MRRITIFVLLVLLVFTWSDMFACTAFLVEDGESVWVGNNEDFYYPYTRMQFIPAKDGDYGRVYFGFNTMFPQGGMNEKGLFYDGFAVQEDLDTPRPDCPDGIFDRIMAECATVEEVLVLVNRHGLHHCLEGMMMFGDETGDSVIIGGDALVRKQGTLQICTNFFQEGVRKEDITCPRYLKAEAMLTSGSASIPILVRQTLKAVSLEDTQYSIIYDLKNKKFFLMFYQDFEKVKTFDLQEELKKGARTYNIPDLFPGNLEYEMRYFEKITPVNNRNMALFLKMCGFLSLLFPLLFVVFKITKKWQTGKSPIFMIPASLLNFIYIMAFSKYSQVFYIGLPESMEGLPVTQVILIHLPITIVVLLSAMVITLYFDSQWKTRNPGLQILFFLNSLVLLVSQGLYLYWDLFRSYI